MVIERNINSYEAHSNPSKGLSKRLNSDSVRMPSKNNFEWLKCPPRTQKSLSLCKLVGKGRSFFPFAWCLLIRAHSNEKGLWRRQLKLHCRPLPPVNNERSRNIFIIYFCLLNREKARHVLTG